MTKWKIQSRSRDIFKALFSNRGLKTKTEIKQFLEPDSPLEIAIKATGIKVEALKKAIKRLKLAIKDQQPIFIYGDYDADGICGTAILWESLNQLGAKVMPFIPNRAKHGYGLKAKGLDDLLKQTSGQPLIVTVDNGIVAHDGVKYAQKLGLEVIITDHHQPAKNLPSAFSIVHSTKLSGTGVAWFLSRELLKDQPQALIKSLLGLAALGTVADMMPLLGVNRSLVKFGLPYLGQSQQPGVKVMFELAGLDKAVELETYHINFVLAPRLNASGRLEEALDALRLICTRDVKRAKKLAKKIDQLNYDRQALTQEALKHAQGIKQPRKKLIFVSDSSYHPGIIGLVAGKLSEQHYRPAIVVSKGEEFSKGSGRSVKGFNLVKVLRRFKDLFVDLGGHPMAAGFTIETKKLAELKKKLVSLAEKELKTKDLEPSLNIDCSLEFKDINQSFYERLSQLAPFGLANPRPVFCSNSVQVVGCRAVGKDQRHLKLKLGQNGKTFNSIGFGLGDWLEKLKSEQEIKLAYTVEENHFNGRTSLQLKLKDLQIT